MIKIREMNGADVFEHPVISWKTKNLEENYAFGNDASIEIYANDLRNAQLGAIWACMDFTRDYKDGDEDGDLYDDVWFELVDLDEYGDRLLVLKRDGIIVDVYWVSLGIERD